MRRAILFSIFFICLDLFSQQKSNGFIENKGQIVNENGRANSKVLYLLNTPGLNVQLLAKGFSYDLYKPVETKKVFEKDQKEGTSYHFHRIDITFIGTNSTATIIGEKRSIDYDSYYTYPDDKKGVINVYRYRKVVYKGLYKNIDLEFTIPEDNSKPVEYNFILYPGAYVSDIKMKFNGAKTSLENNKIVIGTRLGTMHEVLPQSWTEDSSGKDPIAVKFTKKGTDIYSFSGPVEVVTKKNNH